MELRAANDLRRGRTGDGKGRCSSMWSRSGAGVEGRAGYCRSVDQDESGNEQKHELIRS